MSTESLTTGAPTFEDGLCRDNALLAERGLVTDSWHPDSYKQQRGEVVAAIRVCKVCPLVEKCLQFAIENDERHGIWGATTPKQRRPRCTVNGCTKPRARRSDDKGWVSTCHTHHYRPERHNEVAS